MTSDSVPSPSVAMPAIGMVVARSVPGHVIGEGNAMPWRLKDDMKRFRAITTGHVVLMGRRTFQSIGKPLPNRISVVMTRGAAADAGVTWAHGREEALALADLLAILNGNDRFFVIGGAIVYRDFLDVADRVCLTEVDAPGLAGDARFEAPFPAEEWRRSGEERTGASEGNDHPHSYVVFDRVTASARRRTRADLCAALEMFLARHQRSGDGLLPAGLPQTEKEARVRLDDYAAQHLS